METESNAKPLRADRLLPTELWKLVLDCLGVAVGGGDPNGAAAQRTARLVCRLFRNLLPLDDAIYRRCLHDDLWSEVRLADVALHDRLLARGMREASCLRSTDADAWGSVCRRSIQTTLTREQLEGHARSFGTAADGRVATDTDWNRYAELGRLDLFVAAFPGACGGLDYMICHKNLTFGGHLLHAADWGYPPLVLTETVLLGGLDHSFRGRRIAPSYFRAHGIPVASKRAMCAAIRSPDHHLFREARGRTRGYHSVLYWLRLLAEPPNGHRNPNRDAVRASILDDLLGSLSSERVARLVAVRYLLPGFLEQKQRCCLRVLADRGLLAPSPAFSDPLASTWALRCLSAWLQRDVVADTALGDRDVFSPAFPLPFLDLRLPRLDPEASSEVSAAAPRILVRAVSSGSVTAVLRARRLLSMLRPADRARWIAPNDDDGDEDDENEETRLARRVTRRTMKWRRGVDVPVETGAWRGDELAELLGEWAVPFADLVRSHFGYPLREREASCWSEGLERFLDATGCERSDDDWCLLAAESETPKRLEHVLRAWSTWRTAKAGTRCARLGRTEGRLLVCFFGAPHPRYTPLLRLAHDLFVLLPGFSVEVDGIAVHLIHLRNTTPGDEVRLAVLRPYFDEMDRAYKRVEEFVGTYDFQSLYPTLHHDR